MKQNSFLAVAQKKKNLKCERFLKEMEEIIPWYKLLKRVNKHYSESKIGRKKTDSFLLLKIYFLQQWHNLSDPGVEEAIYDRISFQKFLGIDLMGETPPDETTILNFRHFLEEYELPKKFFEIINKTLKKNNLLMKEGTSTDATIIAAPVSTKNKDKKRDKEMSSTKKGNTWHFGMKAHIGVDTNNAIVHSLETTTAKESDISKFNDLLHGEEKRVFADKGYYKEDIKRKFREREIYCGVLDKNKRNRKLSAKQNKLNKLKSRIRAKVEHPFQVLKCQWGYTKTRYKGLFKNSMQLYTLFSLINLYRMRRKLLS
jgi:transposase, IS5 family